MEHRSVGIYCFDLKDGKTPESRLKEAVKDWRQKVMGRLFVAAGESRISGAVPDWVCPSPTAALSGSALWRRESWGLICRSM